MTTIKAWTEETEHGSATGSGKAADQALGHGRSHPPADSAGGSEATALDHSNASAGYGFSANDKDDSDDDDDDDARGKREQQEQREQRKEHQECNEIKLHDRLPAQQQQRERKGMGEEGRHDAGAQSPPRHKSQSGRRRLPPAPAAASAHNPAHAL